MIVGVLRGGRPRFEHRVALDRFGNCVAACKPLRIAYGRSMKDGAEPPLACRRPGCFAEKGARR